MWETFNPQITSRFSLIYTLLLFWFYICFPFTGLTMKCIRDRPRFCQQYFDDRARGRVAIFLNTDWHMEGWENNLNSFTRTLESKDRCFSTNRRTRWIISLSDLLSAIDVRLVVYWKQRFDPLISCLLKTHPDGPDWISDISSIPVL